MPAPGSRGFGAVSSQRLAALHAKPERVHNICIVAHVDHGKTTLADALVASNGVISQRMAGKLRYMDSRADEQARGITVKSSAIALLHAPSRLCLSAERESGPQNTVAADTVSAASAPSSVSANAPGTASATSIPSTRTSPVVADCSGTVSTDTDQPHRAESDDGSKPDSVQSSDLPPPHLINLIDSPGHVDFGAEVSTALSLCDGTLLVVDVVEGVCAQTRQVLRHIWSAGICPVLVLNKIDRLILEKGMVPLDAYHRLVQVIETVNAVVAEICTALYVSRQRQHSISPATDPQPPPSPSRDGSDTLSRDVSAWSLGLDAMDESSVYFTPESGNVVFASACDGWAFTLDHFADMYTRSSRTADHRQLHGVSRQQLRRLLWNPDCYVACRRGVSRVEFGARQRAKAPLFVQLVLSSVWAVYGAVERKDEKRVTQLAGQLGARLTLAEARCAGTGRDTVRALMAQWLPLATTCLDTVVSKLPAAARMTRRRANCLMSIDVDDDDDADDNGNESSKRAVRRRLRETLIACSSYPGAPLVVLVSKMFAVPRSELPQHRPRPLTAQEMAQRREAARARHAQLLAAAASPANSNTPSPADSTTSVTVASTTSASASSTTTSPAAVDGSGQMEFFGFGRVLSGCLSCGDEVFVLSASGVSARCRVGRLYLLMGRCLEPLAEAPAGALLGISGLQQHVLRAAVLSDEPSVATPLLRPLAAAAGCAAGGEPIMRVAVEPAEASQLSQLVAGLRQLQQADPAVRVTIERSGEHVLGVAGEVHLQRCLTDLQQRFAVGCRLSVSAPIAPFRETVVSTVVSSSSTSAEGNFTTTATSPLCPLHGVQLSAIDTVQVPLVPSSGSDQQARLVFSVRAVPLSADVISFLEQIDAKAKASADPDVSPCIDPNVSRGIGPDIDLGMNLSSSSDLDPVIAPDLAPSVETSLLSSSGNRNCDAMEITTDADLLRDIVEVETTSKSNDRPSLHTDYSRMLRLIYSQYSDCQLCTRGCQTPCSDLVLAVSGTNALLRSSACCKLPEQLVDAVVHGFRMAVRAGPLCDEPMYGVLFWFDQLSVEGACDGSKLTISVGVAGQLISNVRQACRRAVSGNRVQGGAARLMLAMYRCEVCVEAAGMLGRLYATIGRRHGQIVHGDTSGETGAGFLVTAFVPVVESCQLASELRKQTSGLAMPQLVFSHWELLPQDPCETNLADAGGEQEEEEEGGDNRARRYMNMVRQRKGLRVDEQLIRHAEKQRTLSKKK